MLLGALIALAGLYVLLHAAGALPPAQLSVPSGRAAADPALSFGMDLGGLPLRVGLLWMAGSALAVLAGFVAGLLFGLLVLLYSFGAAVFVLLLGGLGALLGRTTIYPYSEHDRAERGRSQY